MADLSLGRLAGRQAGEHVIYSGTVICASRLGANDVMVTWISANHATAGGSTSHLDESITAVMIIIPGEG